MPESSFDFAWLIDFKSKLTTLVASSATCSPGAGAVALPLAETLHPRGVCKHDKTRRRLDFGAALRAKHDGFPDRMAIVKGDAQTAEDAVHYIFWVSGLHPQKGTY